MTVRAISGGTAAAVAAIAFVVVAYAQQAPEATGTGLNGVMDTEEGEVTEDSASVGEDDDAASTFTIEITGAEPETKIQDVHLVWPFDGTPPQPDDSETTVDPTPDDDEDTENDEEWDVRKSTIGTSTGISVFTDEESEAVVVDESGEASLKFTIDWKDDERDTKKALQIVVTTDGEQTPDIDGGTGVLVNTSDETEPTLPSGWSANIGLNGGQPSAVFTDTTTPLTATASPIHDGDSYEIFTSMALDPTFEDAHGIGIESGSQPVLPAWGLSFSNFTGTLNANGVPDQVPTIAVPDDPTLAGESFYAVFALKDGGEVVTASSPVEITIAE